MAEKKWLVPLPTHCDICHQPIDHAKGFVDGATTYSWGIISWGIMCFPTCFSLNGWGLGTGKGQKYVNGVKVEG